MAYYPLKVKDSGGTVHVVGDPRIADKADKNSPTLTGTPAAPTATAGTNTTQIATTAFVTTATAGSTKADISSPDLTGTPTAPTAAADTNTTQLATTAFVLGQAGAASPTVNGTAAVGTSLRFARQDHVHGTDTTRAPLYPTIDDKAASYTLVLDDAGKVITMGSATAQTLTIPLNSSVAFPVGTKIDIVQTGAGECSVAPTAGVTLLSDTSKRKVNIQYAAVSCLKTATDTWVLIGALKA